jgi:putative DNA primase/helicase
MAIAEVYDFPEGSAAPKTDGIPLFSDEALALRFAERHCDHLRYTAQWGKWMKWTGDHWQEDTTLRAFDLAREICRETASQCKSKEAKGLAGAATVAAVERLARSDRKLAAIIDQWDAHPSLLNTPGGTVDLHIGECHDHRSSDYLTQLTAVAPDHEQPTPLWTSFLSRIQNEDSDVIAYLQRMAGYALTGSTREHAMFFCYGTGRNGKSVFLNTLSGIMGSYHRTAPIETFTASNSDRHPTELAGLRGARLVTSIETEEGRRWAEAKIKMLTGGDKISARFMRQDFFEYTPQFKLVIAGNHRPGLRSVDEAIRRRFNLLPFTVTIPNDEQDKNLAERLREEWPGILAWMIDGCIAWQEQELSPPEAVTNATAAYLESEDAVAAWLEDCAQRDPNTFTKSAELFASWTEWATKTGEYVGSQKRFSQKLEDRGFELARDHYRGRGFRGLRVLTGHEMYPTTERRSA